MHRARPGFRPASTTTLQKLNLRRQRRLLPLALALFLLFAHTSTLADTHYVSKTGSNTYPYDSWATATDSLTPAVEASDIWDTVRVGPGTFYEHSVWLKTGTVLLGAGMDSTTLVSTEPGAFVTPLLVMGDSSSVQGFFMVGNGVDRAVLFTDGNTGVMRCNRVRGFNSGVKASGIFLKDPNGHVAIEDNVIELCEFPVHASSGYAIIRNNRVYPPFVSPAIFCGDAVPLIEGNIIGGVPPGTTSAEWQALYGTTQALIIHESITVEFCSDFTIRNNVMWGGNTGVYVNNENGLNYSLPWGVVENNTFFGIAGRAVRLRRNNVLVRNNIIANAGRRDPVVEAGLDSVRFEYNLLWDFDIPPGWDTALARSNLIVYPMFQDTLDFMLQAYSPAIDAGDPSILDADGSRSDIGYTGGPGGFTYAYQDLPPAVPAGFTGVPSTTDTSITFYWRGNHEADLDHYEIEVDGILWCDSTHCGIFAIPSTDSSFVWTHWALASEYTFIFRIRSVDAQDNASDWSNELVFLAGLGVGADGTVPVAFSLQPNFPNPFNAATKITYTLSQATDVSLTVYDALGRKVETLVEGPQGSGLHSLVWDARGSASGVYFMVLSTPEGRAVRKALLLK